MAGWVALTASTATGGKYLDVTTAFGRRAPGRFGFEVVVQNGVDTGLRGGQRT